MLYISVMPFSSSFDLPMGISHTSYFLQTSIHIKPCQFQISTGHKWSGTDSVLLHDYFCSCTVSLQVSGMLPKSTKYQFYNAPRKSDLQWEILRSWPPNRGNAAELRQVAQRSSICRVGGTGMCPAEIPMQSAASSCHILSSHSRF